MTRREPTLVVKATRSGSLAPLDALAASNDDAVYLSTPSAGVELAGSGVAAAIECAGPGRFEDAAAAATRLLAQARCRGDVGPIVMGGFAFHDRHAPAGWWSGFPALRLVVPRVLVMRRGDETWRVETTGPGEESALESAPGGLAMDDESVGSWSVRVRRAIADIEGGGLAKVVLSRSRTFARAALDVSGLAARLKDGRPRCTTFVVRRAGATLIGSTPETLAYVRGGAVASMALAGSARPVSGESWAHAAARLEGCPKNRAEHAFVADAVRRGLVASCDEVETLENRVVRRFPEALHLATVYRARVRAGASVLHVAGGLHPTPAVCGVPHHDAMARLANEEPDRGWYAGGVGWMDGRGDGHFAVALRCALARDERVRLFAGAGIVTGSDPAAEWDETEAKMSAMLRVLEEPARAA